MITNFRTAYKIGLSSSLSPDTWSGFNEMSKWRFEKLKERKLHRAFLRGYEEGSRLLRQVRLDASKVLAVEL